MVVERQTLRAIYEGACRQEIQALKPGNVHAFADGHDMSAGQFLQSAQVSSGPLTDPRLSPGARILAAVQATREAVGVNTNLGILLLSAPILYAVQAGSGSLPERLASTLVGIDMADTVAVFEAIVLASPGGLGENAENDVRQPPRVGLVEAMRQAAGHDSVARQYANGFADVTGLGLDALDAAAASGESGMWPCVFAYLTFLSRFPDSHVARKFGHRTAEETKASALEVLQFLIAERDEALRIARLMTFDRALKQQAINPGTSADLTVASLLVRDLRENLHIAIVNA